jgi:PKD domain
VKARVTAAAVLALAAIPVAAAVAKTTPDKSFESTGTATQPGAVVGLGTAGSYEDVPFTIAADDQDGTVSIHVEWSNAVDDFDLYVYRKKADGSLETVGSSAQGQTSSEDAVIQSQGDPVPAGDYIARVQNYASSTPNFTGTIKFGPFTAANVRPKAALTAGPDKPTTRSKVTLDASGSKDSDGKIASYAWDLDGDGHFELGTKDKATLVRHFTAGVHHVAVRVVDDRGARAYANTTIKVAKAPKKKKK